MQVQGICNLFGPLIHYVLREIVYVVSYALVYNSSLEVRIQGLIVRVLLKVSAVRYGL